jgi:hypothetical protein
MTKCRRSVGIGKIEIIRTIQDYFLKMGKQQKLKVETYTTNATLLINGTTIQSLLGLSINKHKTISKPNSIIKHMAKY